MKLAERDELLIRMDERQRQIKEEDLPEINNHLKALNGHLDDHSKRLVIVETKVDERTINKVSKKAIAGYSGGGLLVIAITILQIIQMFNG